MKTTFKVINNEVIEYRELVVHTFLMGDVEDPELYAAGPLYEWQQSESGNWVMENAAEEPRWHQQHDYLTMGYKFAVTAKLKAEDATFFLMKWGSK